MSGWTWALLAGVAYLLAVEVLAYVFGGYWATITGHVVKVMLVHPFVAVAVLAVCCGIVAHFAVDYVWWRSP